MTRNKRVIEYSEDFSRDQVATQVYRKLGHAGFEIAGINMNYVVSFGQCRVEYIFKDGSELPNKPRLEAMLKELNFPHVKILDFTEETN